LVGEHIRYIQLPSWQVAMAITTEFMIYLKLLSGVSSNEK